MSDNTMSLSQKIADFIARAESDQQASSLGDSDFSQYLKEKESSLNQLLDPISTEIKRLKEVMLPMGNRQWRKETEQILRDNKNEIKSISSLYRETHAHISAQCDRLNQATMSTVKSAAQFFVSSKNNSIQKLTENNYQELEKISEKNLLRVKHVVRTLRWKNMAAAFCLSLIVSFIVSLYIDNESPWQAHKQVIQQREDGKALLASWQRISKHDKSLIIQSA